MRDARPAARLTVLTGPSGVGRSRVLESVRARVSQLRVPVAATTRPRRVYEKDGVDRFFLDRPGFERLIAAGGMLEWAEFGGYLYGTPWEPLRSWLRAGRPVLLWLDPVAARQVRATVPGARVVLLLRPDADPAGGRPAGRSYVDATVVVGHAERAAEELVTLLGSSVLASARPVARSATGEPGDRQRRRDHRRHADSDYTDSDSY